MRQIRDRVAGLDVHRDTVVASIRITMSDGSLEVSKERFPATRLTKYRGISGKPSVAEAS